MSMFHELMMRKKEEIMYATIKGTLTENNGVFSGFSASNYLRIQSLNVSITNWELVLNIKSNATTAFLETKNRDILIRQYSATHIAIFMSSQGNATYDIANALLVPLTISTNAWLKISFTGSSYVFSVSYDGINYEVKQTISSSSQIQNLFNSNYINLGYSSYIGSAYNGEINLNRSSIKLGSTKYNLQAVVGYTVVGSPTIVNGVVSGFSSANYVHILNFPDTFNSLEIVTKAKESATGNRPIFALQNGSVTQSKFNLYFTNNGITFSYRSSLTNENKNISISYSVNVDVYYYFRLKISNSKIILGYSTDGTNWVEEEIADTIAIASSLDFRFGIISNNTWYLDGSIDMNETLIKINNKLWFNGQEG